MTTQPEIHTHAQHTDRDRNVTPVESSDQPKVAMSGETAEVGVEIGGTINTGDFENIRYAVSVKLPCRPDDAALKAAHARAESFCEAAYSAQVRSVQEFLAKRKSAAAARSRPFGG